MKVRVQLACALASLMPLATAPLLWAQEEDETAAETPAATESDEDAEASAPAPATPSGERFTPTEQLRYDQEVDFPVDI